MNLLKRLFGGGSSSSGGTGDDPYGLYFYVRPKGCSEIVRVRLDSRNDLSQTDEEDGYIVRKTVMGTTCFQRAELTLTFDKTKRQRDATVSDGELVSAAEYDAWVDSQGGGSGEGGTRSFG